MSRQFHGAVRGACLLLAIALAISGCASNPTTPATPKPPVVREGPAPTAERDRGPSGEVDVSKIADAVPIYEPVRAAGNRSPYTVLGRTYAIDFSESQYRATGIASWYGEKFHGRRTSNGEVYDMYSMTAAHKTLPIPSYLRVTNPANGRSVVVRVNDRGPFHDDRVVDLSYAAAKKLGYHTQGTAMVELERVFPARPQAARETYLQAGAFRDPVAASRLEARLKQLTAAPVTVRAGERWHRVVVGPFTDHQSMFELKRALADAQLPAPVALEL